MSVAKVARRVVRAATPARLQGVMYAAFYRARAAASFLRRGDRRFCPCCHHGFRRFVDWDQRADIRCPRCGAHERQRLLILYLRARTDLFLRDHRVLHFAPEPSLVPHLAPLPNLRYVRADLDHPLAEPVDITAIPFPEGSFDVVICNHVLEHVPDDRRAMREVCRVLAPGGWAILQVPIDLAIDQTLEDPAIVAPADRLRAYGDEDHRRLYGRDYVTRLEEAGFRVEPDDFVSELSPTVVERCGLDPSELIYRCSKA